MNELTLLEKFKKNNSKMNGYIEIFKYINEKYITINEALDERIVKELIELGDYCYNKKEISINDLNSCKEEILIYQIYKQIKDTYEQTEKFEENSLDILCNLEVDEVRIIENIYESISKNLNTDSVDLLRIQIIQQNFKFVEVFSSLFFKDNMNILKFKSYIASSLKSDSIIFIDFFYKNNITSCSFLLKDGTYNPLSQKYTKEKNSLLHGMKNVKYIVLDNK